MSKQKYNYTVTAIKLLPYDRVERIEYGTTAYSEAQAKYLFHTQYGYKNLRDVRATRLRVVDKAVVKEQYEQLSFLECAMTE